MNELELILTDIFNCSRLDLYSNHSFVLKENELSRLDKILKNRARHTPLQYLLGYAEFMGLRFKVNKDVFIPRPETEILVEVVIKKLQTTNYKLPASPSGKQTTKIMDIGTGSGCIAVSLARFLEDVHIVAVDISKEALRVACENAKLHNVEEKVSLLEGDFFRLIEARHYFNGGRRLSANALVADTSLLKNKFDIIVSNPPYVPTSEIGLFDKTTNYEPRIALDGGRDGLDFYRGLSKSAGKLLKKDGLLIMEIGYNEAASIKKIFSGKWAREEFIKDYQGIERIAVIKQLNHG